MNEVTKIKQKEDRPEFWQEFQEAINTLAEPVPSTETIVMDSLPDLMETFEKEKTIEKINEHLNDTFVPRNRAERRAWEKELKKKDKNKRVFADNLRQAAERLAYTEMIQRVRKMNEEFEKEGAQENEATN